MNRLAFWRRDQGKEVTRQQMRALYALSEDILTADSPTVIARRLSEVLQRALEISHVRLYVYDRRARTLEQMGTQRSDAQPFPVTEPPGPPASVAAMSFRNRTVLAVPDSTDSPFFHGQKSADCPRAALFVPMQGPNEPAGLLELDQDDRPRHFTAVEIAAAQHLANLAGIALRGISWRASQEQLFHGQRLASAGQLISSIAGQLKNPLESIAQTAERLAKSSAGQMQADLEQLSREARGGIDTVSRMLNFGNGEQTELVDVDLSTILSELIETCRASWGLQGVQVETALSQGPVLVRGSAEQLEGLFSNAFAFILEELDTNAGKPVSIIVREFAQVVHVEVAYPAAHRVEPRTDPFSEAALTFRGGQSLGVCRSLARHYGGDMRWSEDAAHMARLEVELPVAEAGPRPVAEHRVAPRPGSRLLTILLVDPEATAARASLMALCNREHRVVPAFSTEEASDLMRRFRFDAVFCALDPSRVDWLRIFEQARRKAGGFVLLAEHYDGELAASVQNGEGYVLRKPLEGPELDRTLNSIEKRAERRMHGKMDV
ncbi:MAG: GAF domain-containing protein [Bryobacteraceae bacterium]